MGGEPTFVSIDDMDGPSGTPRPTVRTSAASPANWSSRLRRRFAPGGLLHYGQGKWYPGEQLPRWALGCYRRKDGQPIWNEPDLIADDEDDLGHDQLKARAFIDSLADALEVDPQCIVPGYEDTWHYLWQNSGCRSTSSVNESRLADPLDRARLTRVFAAGSGKSRRLRSAAGAPAGGDAARWASAAWIFRQERMYLIPGDSPMGLRLPLDSLPWSAPADRLR